MSEFNASGDSYAGLNGEQVRIKVRERKDVFSAERFAKCIPQLQVVHLGELRDDKYRSEAAPWPQYLKDHFGSEESAIKVAVPRDVILAAVRAEQNSGSVGFSYGMNNIFLFSFTGKDLCFVVAIREYESPGYFFTFVFPDDDTMIGRDAVIFTFS